MTWYSFINAKVGDVVHMGNRIVVITTKKYFTDKAGFKATYKVLHRWRIVRFFQVLWVRLTYKK